MSEQAMKPPSNHVQLLAVFPLLASIVMMFSSGSLLMVTPNGHHEDLPKDVGERALVFIIAVSTPTTVYLSGVIGPEIVALLGAMFTFMGLLMVTLLEVPLTAVVTVAVFHGVGISLMFNASVIALGKLLLRSNVFLPMSILIGSAVIMANTQDVVELAFAGLGNNLTLTLMAGCVLLLSACPALCLILTKQNHLKCNQSQAPTVDTLSYCHGDDLQCVIKTRESQTSDENKDTELTNRIRSTVRLIWWGIGVDLALVVRLHFPVDYTVPTLMFVVSFITLGHRLTRDRGRSSMRMRSVSSCTSFLSFGLLGISGLLICVPSLHKDVLHHSLVFTAGFLSQFGKTVVGDTPSNTSKSPSQGHQPDDNYGPQVVFLDKELGADSLDGDRASREKRGAGLKFWTKQLSEVNWIVNDVCVEMVLAFCAIALGGIVAYPVSHLLYVMEFSSMFLSKTSLMVLSSSAVLISLLRP